jgi:hypothetical protein
LALCASVAQGSNTTRKRIKTRFMRKIIPACGQNTNFLLTSGAIGLI